MTFTLTLVKNILKISLETECFCYLKSTSTINNYRVQSILRCVYTEYDEIFRTYSDARYETVRGYDVILTSLCTAF